MSDQEPKPTEGPDAPVDVPETKTTESEIKNEPTSEAVNVKDEDMTDVKAESTSDKVVVKDETTEETKAKGGSGAEKAAVPSIDNPPAGMLKVIRPKERHQTDIKNNVKSDSSILGETDDPNAIRKQVEFYFSDSNLPEDKFLWDQVGGEENKAVPLSTICNFKRMRRFKPYSAVVTALKASNMLIIEGEEGKETIRRKAAYDPKKRNKREECSVYVKGFGAEEKTTMFDIEAFFATYGQYDSVRLRRADNGGFKGSVFVEWSDKETADKFMALEPKPLWKEHPLLILRKTDYMKQKSDAIREGKIPLNEKSRNFRGSNRGHRGNNNRGRGNRNNHRGGDPDDWKKRRDADQANGFDDRGDRRDHGGRGRGRGRGRGNFRGRGGRDRNDHGSDRVKQESVPREAGPPKIHTSKEGAKIMAEEKAKETADSQANGKRAREDDSHTGEPAAKKVDTKETAAEAA